MHDSFDYNFDLLAFELIMFTTSSPAILIVNRRTTTRFDPATILQIWSYQKVLLVVEVILVKSKGL